LPGRHGSGNGYGNEVFVDIHSHVVPSGDDGAQSLAEGIALCREASRRGTEVLFATPHVWPLEGLSAERDAEARAAHVRMKRNLAACGLDLRLGFELTPSWWLLEHDPERYRLSDLPFVLMELPFSGSLELARLLAEHIEAAGLTPVIAHPERAAAVLEDPDRLAEFSSRWPLQVNASSLLGRHGSACERLGWSLLEGGLAALVASDGHRRTRPAVLDEAFAAVNERVGVERARPLFEGSALGFRLAAGDGLDVAQRREAV
jgi:protein-tyrosine phosphatase